MRRYASVLSGLTIAAVLSGCTGEGSSSKPAPASTPAPARSAADPVGSGCPAGTVHTGPPPEWTAPAHPPADTRWVAGANGRVVGMLFTDPPKAGQGSKILWIVNGPRGGAPLVIEATPQDGGTTITLPAVPPDSGPGEIYPATDSVPTPGCWILHLSWIAAQDLVAVPFS